MGRVFVFGFCFVVGTVSNSASAQTSLEKLAIEVRGKSRAFAYTNKEDAYYYGETNDVNRPSWQGFNVLGHRFLDDYLIVVDGSELDRTQATTLVYPDYLKRVYPNGIIEELRLADTIAVASVTIKSTKAPVRIEFIPLVSDGSELREYSVGHREHVLLLARSSHTKRTPSQDYPVWLAAGARRFEANHTARTIDGKFTPFSLKCGKARTHTIAFAVADDAPTADSLVQTYLGRQGNYALQRRQRMEQLLNDSWAKTDDARFDMALAWAKLSLDALIMNQVTKGIFAGLPWFNNYWGRDTFISLPGATLVTGRFDEARAILRSFALYQQTDTSSTDYGRIPNIITTTDKAYNTADGTPRFVMMAKEYVERSGDSTFMLEIYPTILRSIEGTIKYHMDSLWFLTHKDAETWMDAVGPDGPWSPRGNRANDVQALWAQQLDAGVWFATELGDAKSAREWYDVLARLKKNFTTYFITKDGVVDHLTRDGHGDVHLRPDQIFVGNLLDDSTRACVAQTVLESLTYEYGVASLSQDDDNFHPYHQYEPYYPKDAAYHNGTVWTWLQGQLISELCRFGKQDVASTLTRNSVHQILDRGAVGTQSELLDAVPRPGEKEPRLSGTFSQAWNLAEFIRNFYDDYLGVKFNNYRHTFVLRPSLPAALGKVRARINLGGSSFQIVVDEHANTRSVIVISTTLRQPDTCNVILPTSDGTQAKISFVLPGNSTIHLSQRGKNIAVSTNGKTSSFTRDFSRIPSYGILRQLEFAKPKIKPGLKALRGPSYPLIPHSRIKSTNPLARGLVNVSDPTGDDIGTGAYTYPSHPYFKSGIFDLTHFSVSVDDSNTYFILKFKALSNPGWHPEYGFQLTYAAIAVDTDGVPGSGTRLVPANSSYMLDEKHAFEKLILVGGGVQLQNNAGTILAAYIPLENDGRDPLGTVATSTIRFALPLSYLGRPDSNWTFTVLTGGQDDHGGAGIGEFRTVNETVGEWNGGGKVKPGDPNVYDVLVAPVR